MLVIVPEKTLKYVTPGSCSFALRTGLRTTPGGKGVRATLRASVIDAQMARRAAPNIRQTDHREVQ